MKSVFQPISNLCKTHRFLLFALMSGILCMVLNMYVLHKKGIPIPAIHDEFSYLLAADTFAQGRLTNPPHPLWVHFESVHELHQPTYMSKYLPAQGAFMALGQVAFGHPIAGVWFGAAFMCMAIFWMLCAWVPFRWAVLGGFICLIQFGIFTYWSQSYWGGAVAAGGGALILGAWPRLLKEIRFIHVLYYWLGIFILGNSRPLESLITFAPLLVIVLLWKYHKSLNKNRNQIKKIIGLTLMGACIFLGWIFTYNKQITGNMFELPQSMYDKQYINAPLFIWGELGTRPVLNHPEMQLWEDRTTRTHFNRKKTWDGFWSILKRDCKDSFDFFLGYPLGIMALFFFVLLIGRHWRQLGWMLGCICVVLFYFISIYALTKPHYIAPILGFILLLIVTGFRSFYRINGISIPIKNAVVVVLIAFQVFLNYRKPPKFDGVQNFGYTYGIVHKMNKKESQIVNLGEIRREELRLYLNNQEGQHLVLVKMGKNNNYARSWVYNAPRIDQSKIVWAWDMGQEKNAPLLNYFSERNVWYVKTLSKRYWKYKKT